MAEGITNCGVAARDGHGDELGNRVKGDIADAESPDEVVDVGYILLMRFRGKEGFR